MDPVKDKPYAQRPDNSAFKQQRLPAWTPMLSAQSVLPFLYLTGLICLVLGLWLTLTVHNIQEIKVSGFPPLKCAVKYLIPFENLQFITVNTECVCRRKYCPLCTIKSRSVWAKIKVYDLSATIFTH